MPLTQQTLLATYTGPVYLGPLEVFGLDLSEPVYVNEEIGEVDRAVAYLNSHSLDDFTPGQVLKVRFREAVKQKTLKWDHCIVDIVSAFAQDFAQPVKELERDVAITPQSSAKLNVSKERRKICFSCPVSLISTFDELCEELAGDYAQSNKRHKTLKVLLEHYLSAHPF